MKRNTESHPRVFLAFILCSGGLLLTMLSFATNDVTAPAVAAPPGFHAAVTVPGSSGGGTESFVGIGFVGARTGNRVLAWQASGAKYNISPDGVNWNSTTAKIPGTTGGGDVSTAVDAFGAYYIAEFCSDGTGLNPCVHKSTDGGTNWTTTSDANVVQNPVDRPWIDVYPKLGPTATITSTTQTRVYLEYHTFSDGQVWLNTSTNGGASFGPPTLATVGTNSAVPDSNCNTVPGGVYVDQRNGTAYALWLSGDDVAQDIVTGCNITQIGPFNKAWVSKSTNEGLTWMIPTIGPGWTGFYDATSNTGDNAAKFFASAAVDYAGQLHVLLTVRKKDQPLQYVENNVENQADTDLVFLTSPDGGAHWTTPLDINLVHDTDNNPSTNPHSYFYAWIYAGAKGMVDAIYYYAPTNLPNDFSAATNSWVTKFSQITGAIANAPGVGGCPPDNLTMNGPACYVAPGPQVAEERQVSNGTIHIGQICTFGLFCDLVTGGDRSLADANNIAIDPAGGANATWTANTPGSQRVEFVCQNSGRSVFDGANAPEPFAGGSAILNGCYGPTDMSITKTDSPDPVAPGGTLTYHLTVTNNGTPAMPATTSGVTLTDVLPAGVTFVSATPSSGTCSGTSTVVCKLGIFPSGVSATVDIVVTAPSVAGTITNTASVAAATTDPTPGNNTATQVTSIAIIDPFSGVVSRKTHGTLTPPGDLPLTLTGTATIECRTGGIPSGNHTLVFNFVNTLNTVNPVSSITATATTSGGTQNVTAAGNIGTDTHQYFVNLTGVPNASHVNVTLNGVTDSTGNIGNISAHMDVLLGDVSASGRTDAGDVTQVRNKTVSIPDTTNPASFRYDVNISGRIDAGDVTTTRNATVTVLP
jgi:uncharacterized repeat protein (TIGR01451 family)